MTILQPGTPVIGSQGLAADQPSASGLPDNYIYYQTDNDAWQAVSAGAWVDIGGGGGGGGVTTGHEFLHGNSVTATSGSQTTLTWDTKDDGDTLLDLTDPANPAVLADGLYFVSAGAAPTSSMTAGKSMLLSLFLDAAGAFSAETDGTATASTSTPTVVTVPGCYFIPSGGTMKLTVVHDDSGSKDFAMFAEVVKIS